MKNLAEFLAVGSIEEEYHLKSEMYNEESNTWDTLPDYPYSGMRLLFSHYSGKVISKLKSQK